MKWSILALISTQTLRNKIAVLRHATLWLAPFLVLAFFLFSCGQDENIAVPQIGNGDDLKTIFTDTFLIESSTFLRDSISSSGTSSLLVGKFENQSFGTTTCNSFTSITLDGGGFLDLVNVTMDSMILVLRPNYLYGNPDGIIKVNIHRIKESWQQGVPYFTFQTVEYDKEVLATISFTANDLLDGSLRVPLNNLGQVFTDDYNAVAEESNTIFDDNNRFIEYFKGLAFVTEVAENSVIGFEFDPSSSLLDTTASGMYYYYKFQDSEGDIDTLSYRFDITNTNPRFNQIIHDRPTGLSALKISNQEISSTETGDQLYLQAGTGLVTKIKLPTYNSLRDNYGSLIVEQATLVIDGSDDDIDFYAPPQSLSLFKLDSNNFIEPYLRTSSNAVGTGFNQSEVYFMDVSSYFNELLFERETITQFLLLPSQNSSTINQLKFGAFQKTNSPIKLIVYYIPID